MNIKKILLSPWTAVVTLALVVGVRFADFSFVESVRLRYFDQLVTSQPVKDIPVHTVNIDEAALDKYGQFPFPRGLYADIIKDLYNRNAGLVVFNILMPEADRFGQDPKLAQTLEKYPVVLPQVASTTGKNKTFGSAVQIVGAEPNGSLVEYPGVIANVSILEERAAGTGVVNTFPEIDGVVRRMPLLILSGETVHPTIGLETLRIAAGDTRIQVKITDMGVEAVRIPKLSRINVDPLSRVWIDWSQQPKQHSLAKLPKDFNGEVVIVGLSAAGLVQPVATARGEIWPQDMQASLLGTLLSGTTIQRPGYADDLETVAILAAGLLLLFLTRWTYVGLASVVVLVGGSMLAASMLTVIFYGYLTLLPLQLAQLWSLCMPMASSL